MQLLPVSTSRLERRRLSDRAWQRYVVDGQRPDGLAEEIVESWRRVRERYAIDPALTQPRHALAPDALDDRRLRDGVLALAAPVLRDLAGRLGFSDHVLTFFDRDGVMLSIDGDPAVVERVKAISFTPGVDWSEGSAGTNGPGTALASGKAVEVCASEHYVTAWQGWSCAAAPVHAPGEAAPVAVVDITGPWDVRRRQAILVATAIARAIEERIRAACTLRDEVVRHAFRASHGGTDALLAVDLGARVVARNDAAARRAVTDAGALPLPLRQELLRALRGRAPGSDPDLLLSLDGRPVLASVIEYDRTAVGAILRVPEPPAPPPAPALPAPAAADDPERARLVASLEACRWKVARAAKMLHVSRMTLYRRMQRLGVSRGRS